MGAFKWFLLGTLSITFFRIDNVLGQVNFKSDPALAWQRHTIDNTSLGADGTKFTDVNKDGRVDLIVGWEEGGVSRIYIQPLNPKDKWPFIELPSPDVEDAFVADLNADGFLDLITFSEGSHQRVTVHWAPADAQDYLLSENWESKDVPITIGKTKWMFGRPFDVDGKNGLDLIIGSKAPNGVLGWLEIPEEPMKMEDWKFHKLSSAGWIMSIALMDMNDDNKPDIVITDRKGALRGLRWLENPGHDALAMEWTNHFIGVQEGEPMFMDHFENSNSSNGIEFIVPDLYQGWVHFIKNDKVWENRKISYPKIGGRRGKSVKIADINKDGELDLVASFEEALDRSGVIAMMSFQTDSSYLMDISGKEGVKYDFLLLKDLDGDGDLDVITSEETATDGSKKGLGVIWYENPIK